MITFVNKKTGNRYPQNGCCSQFWVDPERHKKEYFIILGLPDCSKGWKKFNDKHWTNEEIPDLVRPFTREQFREYVNKYGILCAQEFLDCCDYSKPFEARRILNPPQNEEKWEKLNPWFINIFKKDLFYFLDGYCLGLANTYSIDILKFENHLAVEFGYPKYADGSMADFMEKKFGIEVTDKFRKEFFGTTK